MPSRMQPSESLHSEAQALVTSPAPRGGPHRHVLSAVVNGALQFVGSLLFLCGSILLYPSLTHFCGRDALGPLLAAWLFWIGSCMFALGALQDLWDVWRSSLGKEGKDGPGPGSGVWDQTGLGPGLEGLVPLLNSGLYVIGSGCFVAGAVYFFPVRYAAAPARGCRLFIVGCVLYCGGLAWDAARALQAGYRVLSAEVACASLAFLGALLFLIGLLFYFPEYLRHEAAVVYAVNYFVVGSGLFIVSALCKLASLWRRPGLPGAQGGRADGACGFRLPSNPHGPWEAKDRPP